MQVTFLSVVLELLILIPCNLFFALTRRRPKIRKCLVGKTAIVTGGSQGIGYEICLNLAARGCTVILANRSGAEKERLRIMQETGNPNVFCKKLDLANLESVRNFVAEMAESVDTLDILVNNAGIAEGPCKLTDDGFNPVMLTNYFGPFLLTHLLLDLLKKSPQGRILFMTSAVSFGGVLDPQDLNKATLVPYANSKLAVIMASDYFSRSLKDTNVTSNSYHPGVVMTKIFDQVSLKENGIFLKLVVCVIKVIGAFIGMQAWEVAENAGHFLTSQEFADITGHFFYEDRLFYLKPRQARDANFTEECIRSTGDILKISVS